MDVKKRNDVLNRIFGLMMVILSVGIFVAFFTIVRMGRYEDDSLTVTGPFDVVYNDEIYENVDLGKTQFPVPKKGDHVEYSLGDVFFLWGEGIGPRYCSPI